MASSNRAFLFGVLALASAHRASGQISFHQLYKQGAFGIPDQPVAAPLQVAKAPAKGVAEVPNPILTCSPGFVLNGDMCQGPEYAEAMSSCRRKGEVFQDGACIFLEELKPFARCPEGSQGDGKRCYVPRIGPPEPFCPDNFIISPDGKACIKDNVTKPQQVCPDGFMLKKGACFKETRYPAVPSCPAGYQLVTEGKQSCVALDHVPFEAQCKDRGFVLQGGNCVRETTRPPIVSCPSKEYKEENGMCIRREMMPAIMDCQQGVPGKKGCVIVTEAPAVPTCKKDFVLENSICKRIESRPAVMNCPVGHKMKDGMCALAELLEPQFKCPEGTVMKDKHCIQAVFAPAEASCEKGADLINGQCVLTETRPPRMDCPKGQCTNELREVPDMVCPPGAQLEGRHCVVFHTQPAETICRRGGGPPGPDGCRRVDTSEPVLVCPQGWRLFSGSCVKEEDGEYQTICPPGMVLSGKAQSQQQCEGERRFKPELLCPKSFTVAGDGSCVQVEIQEPFPTCPPGHFISNGFCLPAPAQKQHFA
ncbi:putative oocyst wall protein [Toxoplasma gondii TgCatPRC2]|uniref:Putative oocyst wall protein n=1 Tax=Toxoplasma gondii TgCatPRC2 TaxID=1130821 RepID=A0A151HFS7_TOXGO|nr:putative oocyst wall protein [Toxoplasma gondii TgCatPRC2]